MSTTTYIRNLSVAEAAQKLNMCPETIRRAVRAGAPADRVGFGLRGPLRVSAEELLAWSASRRTAQGSAA